MSETVKVKFGNVNLGDSTARLGIEIARGDMEVDQALKLFCGSRCNVRIQMVGLSDGDGQEQLPMEGIELPTLDTVADIKSFGVKPKSITTGLTISLSEVKPEQLAPFAQQKGTLVVERVSAIPEKAKRKKPNAAPQGATDDEGSTG